MYGVHLQDAEAHLQDEEQELLPELEKVLTHEQLMQLGQEFEWAKLIAPSRYDCCFLQAAGGTGPDMGLLLAQLDCQIRPTQQCTRPASRSARNFELVLS